MAAVDRTPVIKPAAEQAGYPLPLEEFCIQLSQNDSRVELIGAFHKVEQAAKNTKDTEAAYAKRFHDFVNKPA